MRLRVVAKNSGTSLLFAVLFLVVSAVGAISIAPLAAAQTAVGATICTDTSTVALEHPVSDSVVVNATVPVSGTVTQANQIEVRIDDMFDSVIPLSVGQTTFSDSVKVSPGTHTITVTALNVCAGSNGTASAVVTYTPPPQEPSTGTDTPTTAGGVMVGDDVDTQDSGNGPSLLERIVEPLKGLAAWLNIDTGSQGHTKGIPLDRLIVVTIGMYLLIVGLTPRLLQRMSKLSFVVRTWPDMPAAKRARLLGRAGRIVGLILVLVALFL